MIVQVFFTRIACVFKIGVKRLKVITELCYSQIQTWRETSHRIERNIKITTQNNEARRFTWNVTQLEGIQYLFITKL